MVERVWEQRAGIVRRAYGVADVAIGRMVDLETLSQAPSSSKLVTAVAFLTAVRDGKPSLDARVTSRALFSHTSGSDDGSGLPGYDPAVLIPTLVQVI